MRYLNPAAQSARRSFNSHCVFVLMLERRAALLAMAEAADKPVKDFDFTNYRAQNAGGWCYELDQFMTRRVHHIVPDSATRDSAL